MEQLIAIDIHDNLVTAVRFEPGQKAGVVHGYGAALLNDGKEVAETVREVIEQAGFTNGECRISLGANKFSFNNFTLPFSDKRKIEKVLSFELEELSLQTLDELHYDFLLINSEHAGTDLLAATIRRDDFVELLAQFEGLNLDPEAFSIGALHLATWLWDVAEHGKQLLLLDIDVHHATLVLVESGNIQLVRSLAINSEDVFHFSLLGGQGVVEVTDASKMKGIAKQVSVQVQHTLLGFGRSDLIEQSIPCFLSGPLGYQAECSKEFKRALSAYSVQQYDPSEQQLLKIEPSESMQWNPALFSRPLALASAKTKNGNVFNFRKGIFRKKRSIKNLRKTVLSVAIPAGVATVALIGFLWWEFNELQTRKEALKSQVNAVFTETLPTVTRIVDPVQQLKVKIAETREMYSGGGEGEGGISQLALLAELSSRIPESIKIRITRLVADRDDVRIKGETGDFNSVDNVKRELEKSPMFSSVNISSANLAPRGGEVRFELKLDFK